MKKYDKLDYWSLKAQKEGFPARSVYKLKELDEKFRLLPQKDAQSAAPYHVLDLGAAPGSWSLYCLRKNSHLRLISVDLSPLSRRYDKGLFDEGPNFHFIQGDFTLDTVREAIKADGPYALVLCDAAPATSGNRSLDTLRSASLVDEAIAYAGACLTKDGKMAVKVFQGGESGELLKRMKGIFSQAKSHKPEACRAESFETYFVGIGKK